MLTFNPSIKMQSNTLVEVLFIMGTELFFFIMQSMRWNRGEPDRRKYDVGLNTIH